MISAIVIAAGESRRMGETLLDLVRRYRGETVETEIEDKSILINMDYPEEYALSLIHISEPTRPY